MRLSAAHDLLNFDTPPNLPVNGSVEEDETSVGHQFSQEGLGPEVVVDDVILVGAKTGGHDRCPVVDQTRLKNTLE